MAAKRKRPRKEKVIGTIIMDGKEIPIIGWLQPEKASEYLRRMRRKESRELERERREVEKALNKGRGKVSLLEILIRQRNALRGWEDEGE